MIQFKKLAQFFRLLKMMVATMNSIFSISFDKKKFELFISHRTLQKHIIFSLCFKKKRSPSVYDFSTYLTSSEPLKPNSSLLVSNPMYLHVFTFYVH